MVFGRPSAVGVDAIDAEEVGIFARIQVVDGRFPFFESSSINGPGFTVVARNFDEIALRVAERPPLQLRLSRLGAVGHLELRRGARNKNSRVRTFRNADARRDDLDIVVVGCRNVFEHASGFFNLDVAAGGNEVPVDVDRRRFGALKSQGNRIASVVNRTIGDNVDRREGPFAICAGNAVLRFAVNAERIFAPDLDMLDVAGQIRAVGVVEPSFAPVARNANLVGFDAVDRLPAERSNERRGVVNDRDVRRERRDNGGGIGARGNANSGRDDA